jgi:hypothetical protein
VAARVFDRAGLAVSAIRMTVATDVARAENC